MRNRVSLDDKYDLGKDRIFLSGTQALIRLVLMQKARDRAAGLNTAGYVTGYRGSPLGALDQQFQRAAKVLAPADVVFSPAINEDLAATAVWGTQQAEMRGEGRFDGVFGIWYGKGPGVDRSGDAFRHANLAGTSRHGGVLALMGDDHTCESSTTAHQSEFALVDAMMPILNPAGAQEILDFGLYGWALSRYAGLWAGLKLVKDNVESTASIDGRLDRVRPILPEFPFPPGGVHVRPSDHPLAQEARLHEVKLPAARAFIAANALDRVVLSGGRTPRIGIVSTGKSYLDVVEALDLLGIDEVTAADLGLAFYKVGCPWPLDADRLRAFAGGLELLIVVEEKRALIEPQIKELLYRTADAPQVLGKTDETGAILFRAPGALEPMQIALEIGRRLQARRPQERLAARIADLEARSERLRRTGDVAVRSPYFCAGCPHNSSTHVPEGSRAYAGIGCHYMVQWMDRRTEGYTQMGGEGGNWIGEAPFSRTGHVFQNLGDGTYNHSGALAIRAAKAAGVNITYKILYNDAVAMTGGQAHDGGLTVDQIARQVAAEGARRVVLVTDEPGKYPPATNWPAAMSIHHRDELLEVERELAREPGLTVLIYDQTCAAEKRRRRKRGLFPDPDERILINDLVCEGCGDCGVQSNCVAVQPVETEWGRKRTIDQSSCNKDFSCVKGFCPSFVSVRGGVLKGRAVSAPAAPAVPEPEIAPLDRVHSILITGVGGTGVVTVGAVLGMAAHLDGLGCGIIDMAGLAQKGGAVTSHLKLAPRPEDISAIRVGTGGADLVLACDIVVAGSAKVLTAMREGATTAVVNTHETLPGDFTRNPDFSLPGRQLVAAIEQATGAGRSRFIDATEQATKLFGDAIAANMFLLGYGWQMGAIPLTREAIEDAIRLNRVSVEMNLAAFAWGRVAAVDREALAQAVRTGEAVPEHHRLSESLDEMIARRSRFLAEYQDKAYADRFARRIAALKARAEPFGTDGEVLVRTGARELFRLMAIKDEYEVARLYSGSAFRRQLEDTFESHGRLEFHLAPPLLSGTDPRTGRPAKRRFGPWVMPVFGLLARMKRLRGGVFDPFGRTEERRMERRLRDRFEAIVDDVAATLDAERIGAATALLAWPETIRGFGPVRAEAAERAEARLPELLAAWRAGTEASQQAAE
ncbi:indolepyruvate ferredoxin oxidoreductase family protein [Stappia taiwanensis]|uniref:Indolepyruvate ferredoxin oxidoreductase family protein n=1 Tax=Stappia taiwanensis TaxID=992267 RepID=A0A838XZX9_9HYPH|nr:indolepyruvate ferredoxin oxidoreductase family protein [Stappia taiwanensis]MBA4612373.1 indolepyruvate ferredoxin oxidoreductase family protein [Stappia taiwanensis]GGF04863.1 MFS transporter [Stappia taiwanensis]